MSHLSSEQLSKASHELDIPACYLSKISTRGFEAIKACQDFVTNDCITNEEAYLNSIDSHSHDQRWDQVPAEIIEPLKKKAQHLGLWNIFLTNSGGGDHHPDSYSNLEYAMIAKQLGRSIIAPECTNTMAPDTGNMEILMKFGNPKQQSKWLQPLLKGEIRSAFAMTEKKFSSSNALNISTSAEISQDRSSCKINGIKWFISGAGDPRCKIWLVMVKTDPYNKESNPYRRHSILCIDVDKALASGKVFKKRPLTIFGIDDAPHGHLELEFNDYEVPLNDATVLGGIGDGFKIIQARLGPGRLHHCMRLLGVGKEAYLTVLRRAHSRQIYGDKLLKDLPVFQTELARFKIELLNCDQLCYNAAVQLDLNDNNAKLSIKEISMAKIYIPQLVLKFLDWCIQQFGAEGVSQDTPLARMWINSRTLRIADGPDEVHLAQLGKNETKSTRRPKL